MKLHEFMVLRDMITELNLGISILVPMVGLISGLIGTYVSLQNRALLAEVRQELAELENRVISRLNGTYVRSAECRLREDLIHERLSTLAEDLRERGRDGHSKGV